MRIIADANIPAVGETFGRHAELRRVDGRRLSRSDLARADALLVRSVTAVGPALLQGTPVRFVGSATIGIDHLDTGWLEANGIAWANAPGCNADAAAQYTLAMLSLACRRLGRELRDQRVGIVGRGNVGSRLQALLTALEVSSLACDPPLAEAGESGLVPLADILALPVVSLHVPLTRSGPCPTLGMIGQEQLDRLPAGALLLNTSRGKVVDSPALAGWLAGGRGNAALDVWPREPALDPDLLRLATVATPHVAGYSLEGRLNGTRMIYVAFCEWLGVEAGANPPPEAPVPELLDVTACRGVTDLLLGASRIEADDAALRALAGTPELLADGFDGLRRDYRYRRDFSGLQVGGASGTLAGLLPALGFAGA